MSLFLNKIDDPRDALERARRVELLAFARANKISEITQNMPAVLMRKTLRAKGIHRIPIPNRPLGQVTAANSVVPANMPAVNGDVHEINADDDLARQYQAQTTAPVPVEAMPMGKLRAACKKMGIKMERRDNLMTLRAKLKAARDG